MSDSVVEKLRAVFRLDPNLPSLPANVARILDLLEDEEVEFADLAREVAQDPAMALRIVRLANSAAYNQSTEVTSLERAFAVIGLAQVPAILAGFASVGRCEAFLEDPAFSWNEFWGHCSGTAFIATALAKRLGFGFKGAEFLAGLLHDIGYLALAKFNPALFRFATHEVQKKHAFLPLVLEERFGVSKDLAGVVLGEVSELNPTLMEVIRHQHDPENAPSEARPLVAVVALASELSHLIGLTFSRGVRDVEVILEQLSAWKILNALRPQMGEWDVALLTFELERELETSGDFIREARSVCRKARNQ